MATATTDELQAAETRREEVCDICVPLFEDIVPMVGTALHDAHEDGYEAGFDAGFEAGQLSTLAYRGQPNVTICDNGLKHLEPVKGSNPGDTVRVCESSAYGDPHIWLDVTSDVRLDDVPARSHYAQDGTVHLTLDAAREVAAQLLWLCEHHHELETVEEKLAWRNAQADAS